MIAALGVLSGIYAYRHRYGSRLLSGFAIPANLTALCCSVRSMTSILVVLPIGLYIALLGTALRRRSGAGLLAGFVIILLGLLGAAAVLAMSGDVLAALGRNATLSNRTRIWGMVLSYIAARPWFGYGLASFWRPDGIEANQIWAALQWQTPHSHNLWLELSLGLGLVGAGVAAWLWATAFWRAGRLLLGGARDGDFALVLLVAIFVDNLTEYAFFRGDDIQWLLFAATFTYLGQELMVRTPEFEPKHAPLIVLHRWPPAVAGRALIAASTWQHLRGLAKGLGDREIGGLRAVIGVEWQRPLRQLVEVAGLPGRCR